MVWWLALMPHSRKVLGSGCMGVLQVLWFPSNLQRHARLTGDSELAVGVSGKGCLSLCVSPKIEGCRVYPVPVWPNAG